MNLYMQKAIKSCFDIELTKSISIDQIIMAVLQPRYVGHYQ